MYDLLLAPFVDFLFMKRALMACLWTSISCAPIGVLLILRRMSLMGDALSHAILPGIAVGYLIWGIWMPGLLLGGVIAGMIVTLSSGFIARHTILAEDASFTGFYLISLSLGILILSIKGGNMNLMHFLFGSVLAVDSFSVIFIGGIATITLCSVAIFYRPFVYECFDPIFVQMIGIKGGVYHLLFLSLVVLNLVAACQTLGTLMALGMMMLPSLTARLLSKKIGRLMVIAIIVAILSSYLGLIFSYHHGWPAGPAIILITGLFYMSALLYISIFKNLWLSIRKPVA